MYQKFRNAGFCVVPLDGEKYPIKWGQYQEMIPSEKDCAAWELKYSDYGLICGKVSNVVALDFDTDDAAFIAKIEAIAGISPVKKVGLKGFTAFYSYNAEASKSWSQNGRVVLELLSDKRMTTIPPSKHRKTGKPYVWLDDCGLLDGLVLPSLNESFADVMDILFKIPKKEYVERTKYIGENVDLDEAKNMLDFISSDCPRDYWIKIGMALRDEFGDAACGLWHDWSAKAASRYNHNAAQSAWRSFNGAGIGIGTLVYEAKSHGWIKCDQKNIKQAPKKQTALAQVDLSATNRTSLVYQIADWITQNAVVKQPIYSFGTALAITSIIKAGKIKTTTELHPNLYIMCLGGSGSGKDSCLESIERLLKAVKLDRHIMGNPASGSGFATGMKKSGGKALLKIDEIGRFMGGINGKNAQFYHADIVSMMIDIYSKSGSTYRGKQFANEDDNPQIVIENPYVSIIGFSVRERMTAAFSSTEVLDGFLNRWLIFEVTESPEEDFPKNRWKIPQTLIDNIKSYLDSPDQVLFISPEVWDVYKAYRKMNTERKKAAGYPMDALYQRLQLQVLKICMLLCDDGFVTKDIMQSSIAIVEQSMLAMKAFSDKITNSQHETDLMLVADAIRENSPISKTALHHLTRRLKPRDRNEILSQLGELGWIHVETKGKAVEYSYIRDL